MEYIDIVDEQGNPTGKKLSVRLLIRRESATGQHISGSCGK